MNGKTIDSGTRVNIAILGTMLTIGTGGAWWASNMTTKVDMATSAIMDLRKSMEREITMRTANEKSSALLEALVKSLDKRLEILESRSR